MDRQSALVGRESEFSAPPRTRTGLRDFAEARALARHGWWRYVRRYGESGRPMFPSDHHLLVLADEHFVVIRDQCTCMPRRRQQCNIRQGTGERALDDVLSFHEVIN